MTDLRTKAERISKLLDDVEDLKIEIKAAFEIAANEGYNAKALRQAIKIYRMDAKQRAKHDSGQTDLFLYLDTLEGKNVRAAA